MKKISKILVTLLVFILSMQIISFASVDDDYPRVYDLYWNNTTARWSCEGRASKYEVVLYRDKNMVTSKIAHSRSCSFAEEMSRGNHEYHFEVRPYNHNTDWGTWEISDSVYIESNSIPTIPITPGIPSAGPGAQSATTTSVQVVYNPIGTWQSTNNYWHFVYSNGVMASNSWLQINNQWFFVDANANMVTGLMNIGDSTYYFNTDGTMATGGIVINGMNHYFDSNGRMVN